MPSNDTLIGLPDCNTFGRNSHGYLLLQSIHTYGVQCTTLYYIFLQLQPCTEVTKSRLHQPAQLITHESRFTSTPSHNDQYICDNINHRIYISTSSLQNTTVVNTNKSSRLHPDVTSAQTIKTHFRCHFTTAGLLVEFGEL